MLRVGCLRRGVGLVFGEVLSGARRTGRSGARSPGGGRRYGGWFEGALSDGVFIFERWWQA